MPHNDPVPCFFREQDDTWERPGKGVLTRAQCREMKTLGLGKFENHGRTFRLFEAALNREPIFPNDDFTRPSSADSDCCISFAEMQANVGIVDDGVRNPRGLIAAAQEKVRWYQHVTTYPDLARGSWQAQSA